MIKRKWALSYVGVSTRAPTCNRALYIDTPRWPDTGSGTSPPPRLVPGRGQDQDVKIKANKHRGYRSSPPVVDTVGNLLLQAAPHKFQEFPRLIWKTRCWACQRRSQPRLRRPHCRCRPTHQVPSGTSIHGRGAEEGICIIPTKEMKVSQKLTTCPGTLRVPFLRPLKVLFIMVSLFFLLLSALSPQIVFVSSFCSSKGIPA